MNELISTNERIRRLVVAGYSNKHIIEKLNVKPQLVYNMRYQINKGRGLGAIGVAQAAPAKTGINVSPTTNISVVVEPTPTPLPKWRVWVNKVVEWLTWR
jgi:hypothetical protein